MQDEIRKSVWIAADPDVVWAALADSAVFGNWFEARFAGPFELGRTVSGEITTAGHEGPTFWVTPRALDPPRRFAFDWPAGDPDEPGGPVNRVTFELASEGDGTRVTVTESGFAALPPEIAARLFPQNSEGWEIQGRNLKAHVEKAQNERARG